MTSSIESVGYLGGCCGGSGDEGLELLIWVFLYCRNVFSLLLKIMLYRFVKVSSSIFLIFVHLILLWMSEHSNFFIMDCSNLLPFHLICKVFGVTYLLGI